MSLIQAFLVRASENVVAGATAANTTGVAVTGDHLVRVVSNDNAFRVRVGQGAVATASDALIPAGTVEYFLVGAGDRVSVIRQGTADANVSVSFLTR